MLVVERTHCVLPSHLKRKLTITPLISFPEPDLLCYWPFSSVYLEATWRVRGGRCSGQLSEIWSASGLWGTTRSLFCCQRKLGEDDAREDGGGNKVMKLLFPPFIVATIFPLPFPHHRGWFLSAFNWAVLGQLKECMTQTKKRESASDMN
jgi:hypothetical protein